MQSSTDDFAIRLARMEAIMAGQNEYNREVLRRIELKLDEHIAASASGHQKQETLEDRLFRLENDVAWSKKLFMPLIGIATALLGQAASRFFGI